MVPDSEIDSTSVFPVVYRLYMVDCMQCEQADALGGMKRGSGSGANAKSREAA
jgi:hypothetical protein